jgi:hypothetical protein
MVFVMQTQITCRMKTLYLILILATGIVLSFTLYNKSFGQQEDTLRKAQPSNTRVHVDTLKKIDELFNKEPELTARMSEFPSMHPLVVHYAIVLILAAAFLQLVNVIVQKNDISWIVEVFLLVGFTAAYIASENFHPHTTGLTDHARAVLRLHDKWSDYTLYTSVAALALQSLYIFFFVIRRTAIPGTGRKRIFSFVVFLILFTAAYSVNRTGHYGAQLVHIEGVGPKGNFLEKEEGH